MKKLYKADEWKSITGKIHIQCDDLVGTGRNWIEPAKVFGVSLVEFLSILRNEYEAEIEVYRTAEGKISFVDFYWTDLAKGRKFKNYLNRKSRDSKYYI